MTNAAANSSFSTTIQGLQIAWDSTSIGLLKECPRKYYYNMVLGRAPRGDNVHLTFGGHYHKALEVYDHMKSAGCPHEDALDFAVRYCLEATVERSVDGTQWRPWISDDSNKNRATLLRTVVWYLEQFGANDPLQTIQLANGKPAVELSFRWETDHTAPDGQPFIVCGHIDRLVEFEGSRRVLDRKTTKHTLSPSTIKNFNPSNQMSLYDFSVNIVWGESVAGLVIDAAQVAVTFSRFLRGDINKSADQREEWYRDTMWNLKLAGEYAVQEYWPMNDQSCGNYGGCPYREICAKPQSTRELWLRSLTQTRSWDPLLIRGDI